ncbi:hypothetical protein Droror1_Dr00023392 [Drosera rotundifolia]
MIGEGKVVCVTGANGYIASWIVKLLLLRGYTVNATVRDLNDTKKTEYLLALEGAKEQLHLFEANLLEDGSFDSAIEGCEGVLHVASPCMQQAEDPQAEIIDPAVKGTLNVLSSCAKVPTVQRVVVTSSMAAVICNPKSQIPGVIIDETWFSDIEMMKHIKAGYPLAKTLAEDAAWKFAKEKAIDLVVVHPFATIGAKTYPNSLYGWIHVKDVANAHIRAFEDPSANGRYCLAESVVPFSEIVKILRELFPELQLPDKCADDKRFPASYEVSKEKAKGLGLEFLPLEVSLKETIESLVEKNFITSKP